MSRLHVNTTTTTALIVLTTLLSTLALGSPLHVHSRDHQLDRRSNVPNHPISGISDFEPSTIAPYSSGDSNEDVAICLAIKDEYHDVTEFLVHHYNHHNIRRFYLMDDGSNPEIASYDYSPFVDPQAITHRYMKPEGRPKEGQQMNIYAQCIGEFGANHKWMGFIDTDEFLEVKAPNTLHGMLSNLENNDTVGALAINWLNHNSGGLENRPPGQGIRQTFTQCLTDEAVVENGGNTYMKSFVKMAAVSGPLKTAHGAQLREGMETVGENGDIVEQDSTREPPTRNKIVLHHYSTRSRKEYEVKLGRGDVMLDHNNRGKQYWQEMESAPSYECSEMAAYSP